jgi:LmbE family N-acetylglucosaminyl deacetylase
MAGDSVRVVIVTDGSGSRAGGLTPDKMASIRRNEVEAISDFYGGASIVRFGLREGAWQLGSLMGILAKELAGGLYDLIYAPSCVDFHPEHLKVAQTLAGVLARYTTASAPKVRIYEMQVPLGIELVNTVSPLEGRQLQKGRAIDFYASQRGALELWKRQARYLGALYGCSGGAEVYWEVDAEAYMRVVAFGVWTWRDTPFSSLTGRPFGDLRAHVRGSAVRRELRVIAEGRNV